jgi:hypothetical protein
VVHSRRNRYVYCSIIKDADSSPDFHLPTSSRAFFKSPYSPSFDQITTEDAFLRRVRLRGSARTTFTFFKCGVHSKAGLNDTFSQSLVALVFILQAKEVGQPR